MKMALGLEREKARGQEMKRAQGQEMKEAQGLESMKMPLVGRSEMLWETWSHKEKMPACRTERSGSEGPIKSGGPWVGPTAPRYDPD